MVVEIMSLDYFFFDFAFFLGTNVTPEASLTEITLLLALDDLAGATPKVA